MLILVIGMSLEIPSESVTSGIRAFQVRLGLCVDPKNIVVCSTEIVCRSRTGVGLFVRLCVNLRITLDCLLGSDLVEKIVLKLF